MGQLRIVVANQTLYVSLEGEGRSGGTLVRLNDGLEARFSSPECLLDLLEGMVGHRTWQAHQDQIIAQLASIIICA
ncbi:MAG: hypothetical protein OHK0015_20500 [Chloroflexi bacterium OHK40]